MNMIAKIKASALRLACAAIAAAAALAATPATAATYTAASSTYSWETTATTLAQAAFGQTCTGYVYDDDEATVNFTGGFTFPMNGVNYSQVRVFSNGMIQMGTDNGFFRSYTKKAMPLGNSGTRAGCSGNLPTTNTIVGAWLDLNPSTGGTISWEQKGSGASAYAVFSWNAVRVYNSTNTLTFQIILYANGKIKMQYQSITGTTWSAANPTDGVQISSTDYTAWPSALANASAVMYTPNTIPASLSATPANQSASTCGSATVAFTAKDSGGAALTTYRGTISLSTSTGHGTWTLASGSGTFTAGAADSGTATYTFVAGDNGSASFTLSNQHSETTTATFTDALNGLSTTSSITFSDNAFVVAPADALGYQVVAGRPHAFTLSFYKKDPTTGNCSIANLYTGSKNLDAWYSAGASHPAAANAPGLSTASSCASPSTLPSSAPATSAGSNNFGPVTFANGVATVYLCTTDVGQYSLYVRDDTLGFSSSAISGNSSQATARPFALLVDQIKSGSTNNPGGTATTGTKFIPAESNFTARASARLWASGQDTVSAGTPDASADLSSNALAPHYDWATSISASNQTPATGTLGALSGNTSIAQGSFSGGAYTATLAYSEAGSMLLAASASNYLGSGYAIPSVKSGAVGRFHPASINLSTNSATQGCSTGSFSYMDQPMSVSAKLLAYGASGGTLTNYDASKGYAFLISPSWRAVDSLDGVDRSSRLSTGIAPTWAAGVWNYSNPAFAFTRSSAPDGPYDSLVLGLSGADADGATFASKDMSYTAAGACSGAACNAKSVSSALRYRFGRLNLSSANGSIMPDLLVQAQTQYWAKAGSTSIGWAPNTLDSCTSIPYADMPKGVYAGSVTGITLPSGSLSFSAGNASIKATRNSGAAISGSAILAINVGGSASGAAGCASGLASAPGANMPWLGSNHCSTSSYSLNPAAKLVWGAPNSTSGSIIYWRENY